ncbi:MAG: hypothetical protein MUC49_01745 [Raineya sp.]|jgi:hypothetical protein|nr:hypothetical protein [Raineya sp.]
MIKERIIVSTIIFSLLIALIVTIHSYETRILNEQFSVVDGVKTKYTQKEVISMIKKLPTYQGDSIVVFDNGHIKSFLEALNGGLAHAQADPPTKQYLEGLAKSENLPFAFVVYRHVVPYYIEEHVKSKKK